MVLNADRGEYGYDMPIADVVLSSLLCDGAIPALCKDLANLQAGRLLESSTQRDHQLKSRYVYAAHHIVSRRDPTCVHVWRPTEAD